MSKILLLGGTGAMGVYLSEILVNEGHEVYITTRAKREPRQGITYLQGNAKDISFIQTITATYSPDAIVDFMVYNTEEFRARVDRLLNASKHYLFLSSYRVFNEAVPLTERSPRLLDSCQDEAYLKTDEYGLTKARQENLLREMGKDAQWTILRPGITFSKTRFQFGCLEANTICYRALQGLPVVIPEEMLDKTTTLTWGRDVALMIARLILNPKAYQEDFIVASSEHHTWREVASLYQKYLGMTFVTCSLEAYGAMTNPWQVKYDRMFHRAIDNAKVKAVTGLKDKDISSLEMALARELKTFKENPYYQYPNLYLNAKIDKLCGTRISLKVFSFAQKRQYWMAYYPWLANNLFVRGLRFVKRKLFHR